MVNDNKSHMNDPILTLRKIIFHPFLPQVNPQNIDELVTTLQTAVQSNTTKSQVCGSKFSSHSTTRLSVEMKCQNGLN